MFFRGAQLARLTPTLSLPWGFFPNNFAFAALLHVSPVPHPPPGLALQLGAFPSGR